MPILFSVVAKKKNPLIRKGVMKPHRDFTKLLGELIIQLVGCGIGTP